MFAEYVSDSPLWHAHILLPTATEMALLTWADEQGLSMEQIMDLIMADVYRREENRNN